jgi:hypothetical protein
LDAGFFAVVDDLAAVFAGLAALGFVAALVAAAYNNLNVNTSRKAFRLKRLVIPSWSHSLRYLPSSLV